MSKMVTNIYSVWFRFCGVHRIHQTVNNSAIDQWRDRLHAVLKTVNVNRRPLSSVINKKKILLSVASLRGRGWADEATAPPVSCLDHSFASQFRAIR